ncbi:MAG: aminotransferase class I/II-fold pyridoxal phosphate-dependent enzyme [Thermoplasmatota archaeon]
MPARPPPRSRVKHFALEQWLSANEHVAPHVIGTSGVASAPLALLGDDIALPEILDYGETPGEPVLTSAVARYQGVPEANVLLTVGGTEADLLVVLGLVAEGETVLVESPTYFPLAEVPRALGARVERFERRFEDAFCVDVDALVARIAAVKPRLVSLTNPNNPTGAVVPSRDLVRIARACEEVDGWLMIDEIFRELAFAPQPIAATLHPRILVTSSLTKCFGLSGLRCGWILAAPDARAACREAKGLTTVVNPILDQHLAARAIERRAVFLERARSFVAPNFKRLEAFVDAHRDRFAWVRPQAAPISAPRLVGDGDDVRFAERALAEAGVLLAPGSFLDLPGHVRIGFGAEPAKFEAGISALDKWLSR